MNLARDYYYSSQDSVFNSWKEGELRKWLVDNGYIKSDFQAAKDKYAALVAANYKWTTDEIFSSWTNSDLRNWLIQNGYVKSDYEAKRDELIEQVQKQAAGIVDSAREYYTWSDARLRTYLAQTGLTQQRMPSTREGLLREVRARFAPKKPGLLDHLKDSVQYIFDTVHEAGGKAEQHAKDANSAISSAARYVKYVTGNRMLTVVGHTVRHLLLLAVMLSCNRSLHSKVYYSSQIFTLCVLHFAYYLYECHVPSYRVPGKPA